MKHHSTKIWDVPLTISAFPVSCSYDKYECFCHYDVHTSRNVTKCVGQDLDTIPTAVLNHTDFLDLSNNSIKSVCLEREWTPENGNTTFNNKEEAMVLGVNKECHTGNNALNMLAEQYGVKEIDMRNNELISLPQSIEKFPNTSKLWLGQNPYRCSCDMLWLRDWLNKVKC